jgi:hypothetical protein
MMWSSAGICKKWKQKEDVGWWEEIKGGKG